MTAIYNNNIPQPFDLVSVSQGQLLSNFKSLDNTFGTDHITYSAAADRGEHIQITVNKPLISSPTPSGVKGEVYTLTEPVTSTSQLYYTNATTESQLSGILAWAKMDIAGGVATLKNGFNIASITNTVAPFVITINYTNALPNTDYLILTDGLSASAFSSFVTSQTVNLCTIQITVSIPTSVYFLAIGQ